MNSLGEVGATSQLVQRSWDARDAILYAIGVGAGAKDPVGFELEFTTEDSMGVTQQVLPTFASIIRPNFAGVVDLTTVDRSKLVHGEQSVTLFDLLPAAGSVSIATTLLGVLDKGSGCLVVMETVGHNAGSNEILFSARMGLFIKGSGGFGGPKELSDDVTPTLSSEPMPERPPDVALTLETRVDQALIYRLSGDRNPLHSDPTFAARAGFPKPILHGLCTYGFTGRGLLHSLCESNPGLFGSISARFSKPVFPGDILTVSIWDDSEHFPHAYRFRTTTQNDDIVMDSGLLQLRGDVSGDL